MDHKRVSIIMLAHNKAQYTQRALAGLLESTWPVLELVFVDNGSTDETPAVLEHFRAAAARRGWTVRSLRFEENVGAIEGRNRAMEEASGDYVVFMDNDIVIGVRRWLEYLTQRLDEDPQIGIIGPKILFAAPPHLIQCAGCEVGRAGRVNFRGRGDPADKDAWNRPETVKALISACWIMPRRVMETVGALDMLFHPVQFEDIDYCYRIRDAGWAVLYDPTIFVYHFENVTTDGTPALNYRYLTIKNGLKFKRKWAERIAREGGPVDADMEWRDIPHAAFDAIGDLTIHD